MERQMNAPAFADAGTIDMGCPRTSGFLDKCERFIPWQALADSVSDVFVADQGQGGRPHYPVLMLLKCLMSAKWFGLSDPDLEWMRQDRLSFRQFVGLGLSDATPDETTFVVFRRRLRGQDELTIEQVRHNRQCAAVRAIVEHPFAWIKGMGYRIARYRGIGPQRLRLRVHAHCSTHVAP
jgi:hypothetical protein